MHYGSLPGQGSLPGTSRLVELRACLWLAARGYDVFACVTTTGPADLAAFDRKTGELILVKVRRATSDEDRAQQSRYRRMGGSVAMLGVHLLVHGPDTDDFTLVEPAEAARG